VAVELPYLAQQELVEFSLANSRYSV